MFRVEEYGKRKIILKQKTIALLAGGLILAICRLSVALEPVTVDTYVRAETDATMGRYVKQGGFGKFLHVRNPTPINEQKVIRMNRDTIYSFGVFDLTEPVTIVKPDAQGRFQSMQVINQDHFTIKVVYDDGEFTLTRDDVGTRYVCVIARTFVDGSSPADIEAANRLQDEMSVQQASPGVFEVPEWDEASLTKVRDALLVLAATRSSAEGMFGSREEVDPVSHLLGAAYGWGGNPDKDARYVNVVPKKNDGKTPYTLTVPAEVPVSGFWSITIYNAKGFMEENEQSAYSVNNVTARKNADGTVTINFGGDPSSSNYLPITPGWNYIARLYRPDPEVLDGSWLFPAAVPME